MAKYDSADVGFMLLGSYSMLGAVSKIEDTVELKLNETPSLGQADESYWSSGARKTEVTQDGWFDDDAGSVHEAFVGLSDVSLPMTIAPHGNTINGTAVGTVCDIYQSVQRVGYTVQLSVGDVTKANGKYGIYYGKKDGRIVAPLATRSTAGNTDAADARCSSSQPAGSDGGAAVLHITELTGTPTNCTVTLRHSTDGTTYTDKQAFSAFTPTNVADGIASQYIALTGQINQYVSAGWAYTGGTAPTVTFAVAVYVAPAP